MSFGTPGRSPEITPEEEKLLRELETSIKAFVETLVNSAGDNAKIPAIPHGTEKTPAWTAVVGSLTKLLERKEFRAIEIKARFASLLNSRLYMSNIVITDQQEDATLYMTGFTAHDIFEGLFFDAVDNIRGLETSEAAEQSVVDQELLRNQMGKLHVTLMKVLKLTEDRQED